MSIGTAHLVSGIEAPTEAFCDMWLGANAGQEGGRHTFGRMANR